MSKQAQTTVKKAFTYKMSSFHSGILEEAVNAPISIKSFFRGELHFQAHFARCEKCENSVNKYLWYEKHPSVRLEAFQTLVVICDAPWPSASKQLFIWKICKFKVKLLGSNTCAKPHLSSTSRNSLSVSSLLSRSEGAHHKITSWGWIVVSWVSSL